MRLTPFRTETETKWYHFRVLQLIKDYRESQKVRLNVEHRLILSMAPDYDKLPIVQKCEVRVVHGLAGMCKEGGDADRLSEDVTSTLGCAPASLMA
jgi:hypothetical protein